MTEPSAPRHWRAPAQLAGRLTTLLVPIAALAALDVWALEICLKPLSREYPIPWSRFEWELLGIRTLSWHFFFVPASVVLLAFAGFAVARWRGSVAGVVLFASGFEDLLYYALLREPLPAELPWLDPAPMAWTRVVLRTEHVTCGGLVLSAALGLILALALLWRPATSRPGTRPAPAHTPIQARARWRFA